MESYAKALTYAIPVFLLLIGIEAFVSWRRGLKINRGVDMISSLSSGMTNIIKDVLGLSIAIVSYTWLVDKIALFDLRPVWYVYVLAFIAKDFAGYWIHRMEHSVNLFWNRHIIHHSSEEFNLSCALRQSISEVFSFVGLFLLPAAVIGVPAQVIAVIAPVQLFAQFWYHTRLIDKMGWLEYVIVTPSHHRVHHAINAEYIDRNFSQIFIIWDKLFGTFQPELKDVPPVYGVKRPLHTWNPILISVRHLGLLIRDAWRTQNIRDKIRIWFMPTGWRPADVKDQFPVESVEDVFQMNKYDTRIPDRWLLWSWCQYAVLLMMTLYLFFRFAEIGFPGVLIFGLFLFVSIFSLTATLDRAPYAVWAEGLRLGMGLGLIGFDSGKWLGLHDIGIGFSIALGLFLVISFLVTLMLSVRGQLAYQAQTA